MSSSDHNETIVDTKPVHHEHQHHHEHKHHHNDHEHHHHHVNPETIIEAIPVYLRLNHDTELHLIKHNITLSDTNRIALLPMNNDCERQKAWAVNPMMQFFIERTMNQLMAGFSGTGNSVQQTTITKPIETKVPDKVIPKVEPKVVEEDDTPMFDLFG